MALYSRGPTEHLVARADDLLHLVVEITDDRGSVSIFLPAQHVMEYPLALTLPGVPVMPSASAPLPALGAESSALRYSHADVVDVPGVLDDVLRTLSDAWCTATLQYPTMVELKSFGRSRWDLMPEVRTRDGWTAVWQGRLLETELALPGAGGPLLEVTYTQMRNLEPSGFGVLPFTLYPEFRGAVFEARLTVSMLGASGRIRGPHWPPGMAPPFPPSVESYMHATQFGRDTESHAVIRGFLSSGHPAQIQVDTTRVFSSMKYVVTEGTWGVTIGEEPPPEPYAVGQSYLAAHLSQTATLTVLDTTVGFEGMNTPFRSLRFADAITSTVDPNPEPAYWLTRGNVDARFNLVGTDWDGRDVPFAVPLMFVTAGADRSPEGLSAVFLSGAEERRSVNLGGAAVALADRAGRADLAQDATTLPVHKLTLGLAAHPQGASALVPAKVDVALGAVGRLTGTSTPVSCSLLNRIDEAGNFLTIDNGLAVTFAAADVGGLATPNCALGAVNALSGAIPTEPVAEAFVGADLLGVPLASLLDEAQTSMPLLRSATTPEGVVTTYLWNPELNVEASDVVRFDAGSSLLMSATMTQPLRAADTPAELAPPSARVQGTLSDITLSLLDVVRVRFSSLEFLSEAGASPTVTATGVTVAFGGDLRFVEALAATIGDFPRGCPVQVEPAGITAGYHVSIPAASIGVFSLTNISLAAEVKVPFDGRPTSVRFSFAERHAPFTLGVGIFGGGGHLALTASSKELSIEGALEFGGNFDISVLVASGRVFAMGGVAIVKSGDTFAVEGYLRCGGHLEILDAVGVSIEFDVSLGYTSDAAGSRVHGSATVTVGVEILLFEESVSFTVEKSFPTDGAERSTVEERFDEPAWEQLCDAFASEPA